MTAAEEKNGEAPRLLQPDYHHPIEDWLDRPYVRRLLGWLTRADGDGVTPIERAVAAYARPGLPLLQRLKYWPVHRVIDYLRGDTDRESVRQRIAEHAPTVRGLVVAARSVAEYGLTVPQRFCSPLFAVWNFTNRCNLTCRHCYQSSGPRAARDELSLDEKLDVVDQMGRAHMPMLALSGGEPTLSEDLLPVLRRTQKYKMHISLATNGTTITPDSAKRLADAGVRYVEISLDSPDPARHDEFRGIPGMWKRSVAGAGAVVATEGLRLGIAMCVHRGNLHEVPEMIKLAEDLGAGCFAHFNFIPVGRGVDMAEDDITPQQRQQLLEMLNEKMQEGGMGVISTAPQLGRVCLGGYPGGKMTCSHAGSGSGAKARVVAKYLGGCGAGRTYVCIQPNGDVTPCVYMPHQVMGNLRRRPLVDIYRENPYYEILNDRGRRTHHCGVCDYKNYCGGCRARAYSYFGDVAAGDPGCIFNEKYWNQIVRQNAQPQTAATA